MATVTVKVAFCEQEMIRCVAREDVPEYGLKAGDVFYLSRSSKDDGTYYITRYDNRSARWFCSCPARKPCKHENAAGLHSRNRSQARTGLAQVARTTYRQVVKTSTSAKPAQLTAAAAGRQYAGPLNGNKPFSLMR